MKIRTALKVLRDCFHSTRGGTFAKALRRVERYRRYRGK